MSTRAASDVPCCKAVSRHPMRTACSSLSARGLNRSGGWAVPSAQCFAVQFQAARPNLDKLPFLNAASRKSEPIVCTSGARDGTCAPVRAISAVRIERDSSTLSSRVFVSSASCSLKTAHSPILFRVETVHFPESSLLLSLQSPQVPPHSPLAPLRPLAPRASRGVSI